MFGPRASGAYAVLRPTSAAALLAVMASTALMIAPSAAQADRTYVPACGSIQMLEYRPGSWSFGCTGGSLIVRGIRWSTYRSSKATGKGRAWLREPCGSNPTCSEADYYKATARVRFSRPQTCNLGEAKLRYYSRARIRVRVRKGNPFGYRPGWKTYRISIPRSDGACDLAP